MLRLSRVVTVVDNSQVTELLKEEILNGTRRSRLFRRSQECSYDRWNEYMAVFGGQHCNNFLILL